MKRLVAVLLALGALAPATAQAAPPNDLPANASAFQTVTAENGPVSEREANAVVADATPDAGVPRCLGPSSFERTVWYRVESAPVPRRVKVEASGSTTEAPDLAAFVQSPDAPSLAEPQACDGPGSPIADAGEGSSVVDLHVPAGRQVLIQAGRNAAQAPRAILLALATTELTAQTAPAGDVASGAPALTPGGEDVALAGATLTEEDPAQPACPAAASVWRRVDGSVGRPLRIVARGAGVGTLTAFSGPAPSGDGALGCADRRRADSVELTVTPAAGVPLWVRVGVDAWTAGEATLRVEQAPDPVAGIPAGGGGCSDRTRPTVRLRTTRLRRSLSGTSADTGCGAKVRQVEIALQRISGKRCQAVGRSGRPGRRLACSRRTWVRASGTTRWSLTYKRKLPAGRYVLRVRARGTAGNVSKTLKQTVKAR